MKNRKWIVLGLICCMPSVWAANYKWKDASGETFYGQNPPAGVEAQEIKSSSASSSAQSEIEKFESKQEALNNEKEAQLEEDLKEAQEREQRKIWAANCHTAKLKLASLEEKPKVRKHDAYGNLVIIPEAELKSRITEAHQDVELFCNPPTVTE